MYSLLTLALVASVSALASPALQTPPVALVERQLAARATTTDPASCVATLSSMISAVPTPTDDQVLTFVATALPLESVASVVAKNPKIKDTDLLCTAMGLLNSVTPPADLATAYSSWSQSLDAWYSSYTPVASTMAPQCGDLGPIFELLVAKDTEQCKKSINKLVSSGTVTAPRVAAVGAAVIGAIAVIAAI